jgi:hypothetical protein
LVKTGGFSRQLARRSMGEASPRAADGSAQPRAPLMSAPDLLAIDEPSLGLAPNLVEQMLETIRRLNREGITILLVIIGNELLRATDTYRLLILGVVVVLTVLLLPNGLVTIAGRLGFRGSAPSPGSAAARAPRPS